MLLNNYKQALSIIDEESPIVHTELAALGATHEDLEEWAREEKQYFDTLGAEEPWDIHAVEYVTLLRKFRDLE